MIYIKNNKETQTIYIPRTELNTEAYVSAGGSYEEGYRAGQKIQTLKLAALPVSENGLYEREDGWNKVEVNVAGGELETQSKTVYVSKDVETVYPDKGYDALDMVKIDAIEYKAKAYDDGYKQGKAEGGAIRNVAEEGLRFGYAKFKAVPQNLDFKDVENMDYMFAFCTELETVDWMDTSNVKNMVFAFTECFKLNDFPEIDTSKVTNMRNMFSYCKSLTTIPQLDTSMVTDMSNMFHNCDNLTAVPYLDTSNVKDMSYTFSGCEALATIPELNTGNVTNMTGMFNNTPNLTDLPEIDATNATDLSFFFGDNEMTNLTNFGGFRNLKTSIDDDYCLVKAPNLNLNSLLNIANKVYDFTKNNETPTFNQGVLKLHPDVDAK